MRSTIAVLTFAACAVALWSCGGEVPVVTSRSAILFSTEGNRLNAYDVGHGLRKQTVVQNHALDPAAGRDVNGQVCFVPDGSGRFIAGEDTDQPQSPQGWGFFQLHGDTVGTLSATQIGKLVPTYQDALDVADNYGCAFFPDGRLVLTDIGRSSSGPATGQLVMWFPPFDVPSPRYCKIDLAIGTAGGIYIDREQRIYVASARVQPGIYRYTGPFPTSDDAAGGCGRIDNTGAPLADALRRERFILPDGFARTPNAIVQSAAGTFYVSSVFNGVIAEYDAGGRLVRPILRPPLGTLSPFPTGTPFGLALGADGTLYYADLGLVFTLEEIGPGRDLGNVRRIRFVNGEPQPPELIDRGLNFPDGLGLWLP
jgi:hypothetical protein